MLMKKDLLISDIDAYRLFNTKYNLDLNLITNNPESICQNLKFFINGFNVDSFILDHRKKTIEENFNFDTNIKKMMDFYNAKISD